MLVLCTLSMKLVLFTDSNIFLDTPGTICILKFVDNLISVVNKNVFIMTC